MNRYQYPGLAISAGIIFVFWLLSQAGFFGLFNALLYDGYVAYSPPEKTEHPKVLLIDVTEKQLASRDEIWLPLIASLEKMGARQIGFLFVPDQVSDQFFLSVKPLPNVLFGQQMSLSKESSDAPMVQVLPEVATRNQLNLLPVIIQSPGHGVYRSQINAINLSGKTTPVFETAAARQFSGNTAVIPEPHYLVNFMGGTGKLPVISLDKALAGDLIPELVKGRSVLIGSIEHDGKFLYISSSAKNGLISPLEFHGQALESLLSGRTIHQFDSFFLLPLLVLIVAISLLVFQRIGNRLSGLFTVGMVALYGLVAWLALTLLQVWVPLAELALTQVITLVVFFRRREMQDDQAMHSVILETSAKLRDRIFPPSFLQSQEHWSQVITMVNQTLDLSRVIFLERVQGDHRVKEIKALNCSLDDISELRRDYERTPYSTAIAENKPIVVENYLKQLDAENREIEYLVPLQFSGEVLGFWAFSILPEKIAARASFDTVVRDFGMQIAELLFHRQQWLKKQADGSNELQRYLRLEGGQDAVRELNKSIALMEKRLIALEDFLDGLSTSAILYDLFGRVVLANLPMVTLLKRAGYAPYDMTALDLITILTGLDTGKIRNLIEHVVVDRGTSILPVAIPAMPVMAYVLNISPLQHRIERGNMNLNEALPFELEGILCELIDVTTIKRLCVLKQDLAERVNFQLRNDMTALLTASSLLKNESLTIENRDRVLNIVQEKITDSIQIIQESQDLLMIDLGLEAVESYPVEAKGPLSDSINGLKEMAALRNIAFEVNLPDLVGLVFAAPDELKGVMESLLRLLVIDAAEDSIVKVNMEERDRWITYTFENSGFGMPDERFQEYVYGDEEITSEEYKKVRRSLRYIHKWGGTLTGSSSVGVGVRFKLVLRGFI